MTESDEGVLIGRMTPWLRDVVPQIGIPVKLEKFPVGQSNPTYRLHTNLHGQIGRYVLRTQPSGVLLKSAHAVDREFRVMQALGATPVPVPEMIALCDDSDIIGVKFFVMREVAGTTIFNPSLPGYSRQEREELFRSKVDVLATLAQINPLAIGLDGFGKPDRYLQRQLGTWTRQYRACETETLETMEFLVTALPDRLEKALPGFCVIHGDFRVDNLLIENHTGIAALIDWELSTLGPAFIDLSYWCAMLRMDCDWPIGGLGEIDRKSLGLPDEATIVEGFCQRTGLLRPVHWEVLIAFQCFRFAAILQGILKRHLDGNASANNAAAVGGQAKFVAALGADVLRTYLSGEQSNV